MTRARNGGSPRGVRTVHNVIARVLAGNPPMCRLKSAQGPCILPAPATPRPREEWSSYDEAERTERRSHRERSEEHTSELQSRGHLVCRLLLEKKKSLK